ncbi:MAG: phenylalanine--tRNA ligase subunit beta [Nitrosomonas sp.]|nr:phenylalanine--tRNA ligase subunit beta [Nitrosomonas sp.]
MRFSENWLRTFVDPLCSSDELAHTLTMAGLEVESMASIAPYFQQVVVAEVMSVQKHPNADRLSVCDVNVGEHTSGPLQIVCGASNVRSGMKTVCAMIGAQLPGLAIRRGNIREVESFGMLCSFAEIGLSDDTATGIIDLPCDAPVGQDFRQYYTLDDHIFTLKLTPNRADCLGMYGIAREVAAITASPLVLVPPSPVPGQIADVLPIQIEVPDACPLYCGRVIKGIAPDQKIPLWMAQRLQRSGLREVNAVVDIVNYVLLETGQPMHAFDLDKIACTDQRGISVRYAGKGEHLQLLNGIDLQLDSNMLIIADHKQPLALAGIMGGSESGVNRSQTHSIFLESAFFSPAAISGKSFELGFTSDAAHRFERGVDFSLTRTALERATALILEICGGVAGSVTEVRHEAYLPQRFSIRVRLKRVNSVLGIRLGMEEIVDYFNRLKFDFTVEGDSFSIVPPAFRFDLAIEEDFIEEIARIHGYDRIPASAPKASLKILPEEETGLVPVERLRQILVARDYQEVINYAFVEEKWEVDFAGNHESVRLKNPIASHMSVMRSSLLGGLVSNLQFNFNRKQSRVRIFEIGRCFQTDVGDYAERETENIAGLCFGGALPEQWAVKNREIDFFDVKADIESLFTPNKILFEPGIHPAMHPGKSAKILVDDKFSGWLGELHPRLSAKYHLPGATVLFEIKTASTVTRMLPNMRTLSKFPPVRRDLAFEVDTQVVVQAILDAMYQHKADLVVEIALFDFYSGDKLAPGKKSLAFRLLLQDLEKTLTDQEIDQAVNELIDMLAGQFGAVLRS